ncbi:MAG TPA: FAD-binding oxidoreductase [Tepidisphaeraceae bacterium]|nr:FAD-binding oxidoreductase [Tepidisphaeraceae bacterium]
MQTRRELLIATASAALAGCASKISGPPTTKVESSCSLWVNDVHSQLNRTRIAGISYPRNADELMKLLGTLKRNHSISVCGGRHAGGGQQFCTDRTLVDLREMNQVRAFDSHAGVIDVEAGITWPVLMEKLRTFPDASSWAIRQKQGGADEVTLGGAIGSNIHSRHLHFRPFVQDIESMQVILPDSSLVTCSRTTNAELFAKIIGGYGLLGIVCSMQLRLERRVKLVMRAVWIEAEHAVARMESARDSGAWHGGFQPSIDPASDDFCKGGLLTWFEPAPEDAPVQNLSRDEAQRQFVGLATLAHADKEQVMNAFRSKMLSLDGKIVDWSDQWMRTDYQPGYHRAIDKTRGGAGSEILSEIHVPRASLADFLREAKQILLEDRAELIYSLVRLIERDNETFLTWAKQDYACVIFNLHTQLDRTSIDKNAATFRKLLDAAIRKNGSYYLTYHRFARRDQLLKCYPQLPDFLQFKKQLDPQTRIESDWHRSYANIIA